MKVSLQAAKKNSVLSFIPEHPRDIEILERIKEEVDGKVHVGTISVHNQLVCLNLPIEVIKQA